MSKSKGDETVNAYAAAVEPASTAVEPADPIQDADVDQSDIIVTAATVAVVGVGVAVFEAALLPGVVLGVAAALVPKALPNIGAALHPLFRSTVRGAYNLSKKTREFVAETQEHVHDIVAEANAAADAKLANAPAATSVN
jgi:hypothetical protein